MNPMKYRKAKWVKVPDGVTAAQIQVAAEQIDAMKRDQQVRIDHFMDDLKQKSTVYHWSSFTRTFICSRVKKKSVKKLIWNYSRLMYMNLRNRIKVRA